MIAKVAKVQSKAVATNVKASGRIGERTMFKTFVRSGVSRPRQWICLRRGSATQ